MSPIFCREWPPPSSLSSSPSRAPGPRRLAPLAALLAVAALSQAIPAPALAQPKGAGSQGAPDSRPSGRVLRVEAGEALVEGKGWVRGDEVEFVALPVAEEPDEENARGEEVLARGRVLGASATRARVRLGLDEQVPAGALARPARRPLPSYPFAPPRPLGLALRANVRAFMPLDAPLGVGAVSDAAVVYRFEAPVSLHGFARPAAFVTSSPGGYGLNAGALVAFDTDLLEAGLGAGGVWATVAEQGEGPRSYLRTGGVFMLAQHVRLGAVDGLSLRAHVDAVAVERELELGDVFVDLQVPLGERFWAIAEGGGGSGSGTVLGGLGVRHLVRGNGGKGSVFLSGLVGGAGVTRPPDGGCCSDFTLGPSVSFGLELRP